MQLQHAILFKIKYQKISVFKFYLQSIFLSLKNKRKVELLNNV